MRLSTDRPKFPADGRDFLRIIFPLDKTAAYRYNAKQEQTFLLTNEAEAIVLAELRRGAQERLILHCDCNNFFASCECIDHPELKNVPMAVAGDPATRTGIVVAKNELAKKAGVRTTDTVWQAKRKCPGLVLMPPRHRLYSDVSRRVNQIYLSYTDRVEPASIDESYLDLSGTLSYYGMTARQLADDIRRRVREEIGVTISVGVSYNKVFAKMGSDYRKPDATTLVTPENFRDLLWPLPIREMLFVGRASARVLTAKGIYTIGALGRARAAAMAGQGRRDALAQRQWAGRRARPPLRRCAARQICQPRADLSARFDRRGGNLRRAGAAGGRGSGLPAPRGAQGHDCAIDDQIARADDHLPSGHAAAPHVFIP